MFLIIISAYLGSGDYLELNVMLKEGNKTNKVLIGNQEYILPFEIKLIDFEAKEYPPKVVIYDMINGNQLNAKNSSFVKKGLSSESENIKYKILEYVEYAVPNDTGFVYSDQSGSTQAALIEVYQNNIKKVGWISLENALYCNWW